jgi:ATP-binding cassette subfamily F protein 3
MAKAAGDDSRMRAVKSRQRKLDDRWGAEVSAKGTRFKLNRDLAGYHFTSREQIQLEKEERDTVWTFDQPAEIKGSLVTLENVALGYGRGSDVLAYINLVIHPGSRTAIVGAVSDSKAKLNQNGQGKSTLAQALVARLKPTRGILTSHSRLKIGYYSQHAVDALPTTREATALSHFIQLYGIPEMTARAALGRIGLQGKVASHTATIDLSGGQKVRLAIAIVMFERPNLL